MLLKKGIFFIPSQRGYISAAHTQEDIDKTLETFDEAFRSL